jgi:hypothetical protein
MKKQLLEDINRTRIIMGLNVKKNILNEDGIIKTLAKKAKNIFLDVTDETTSGGVSTGKKIVNNIKMNESDYVDILDALENELLDALSENQVNLLKSVILKNPEFIDDIYDDLIKSVLKNTNTDETQLIKRLKNDINNNNSLEEVLKDTFPNADEFTIDILFTKFDKKIKELEKSGKLSDNLNLSNELFNSGRWSDDILEMTDDEKKLISKELTPSVIDSIKNFFTKFNDEERVTKLQKYLKLYSTTNDAKTKITTKKLIEKDFSDLFLTKRKVYEEIMTWCDEVSEKYKGAGLDKIIGEFKDLAKNRDYKAIATLSNLNGPLSKLSTYFNELLRVTKGKITKAEGMRDSIYPSLKDVSPKMDRFISRIKNNPETEKITNDWVANWVRWIRSGSSKGFPRKTNELWLEFTDGSLSGARKKYAMELFGRYMYLNLIWGTLTWLRNMVSYGLTSIGDDEVEMCISNLNSKIQSNPNFFNEITDNDQLPSPCGDFGVLWAVQYETGDKVIGMKWLGNLLREFPISKLNDKSNTITDIFPGKLDDIIDSVLSSLDWVDDRRNLLRLRDSLSNKIENTEKEIEEEKKKIVEADSTQTNVPVIPKISGDEKGFKQYLLNNKKDTTNISVIPASGVKPPKGIEANDAEYEFINDKWTPIY